MAFILEVAEKHLAYGMNWGQIPAGRGERSKIADMGGRFNASHKLRMTVAGHIQHGFLEGGNRIAGKVKKGSILSAAALFSSLVSHNQNSILVYLFDNKKKAAVIALIEGVVYQDAIISLGSGFEKDDGGNLREDGTFDLQSDSGTAKIRDRIDAIYNETGKDFIAYGNYFYGFPDSLPMTPEDLLQGDHGLAALTKFSDPRGAIKVGIFALIVAVSFLGYSEYQAREKKRKELEALKTQVNPMDAYRKNLITVLAKLKFGGKEAQKLLVDPMFDRQIEVGGWYLSSTQCTKQGECEEKWLIATGTNQRFIDINKLGVATLSPDLKTITNNYSLKTSPTTLTIAELPIYDDFWRKLTTQAQLFSEVGVIVKAGQTPAITFSLPAGISPKQITPGAGIARAEVSYVGPIGLTRDVLQSLPENVQIDEIKITLGDSLDTHNFSIKGYYYVKK